MHLRALHRKTKLLYQVEGVEAAEARHVEIFGEHQYQQHRDRSHHDFVRIRYRRGRARARSDNPRGLLRRIPTAHLQQQHHAQQCRKAEPGDAALAKGHDDRRRDQRPDGRAHVATNLEYRLRKPVLSARRQARNAR